MFFFFGSQEISFHILRENWIILFSYFLFYLHSNNICHLNGSRFNVFSYNDGSLECVYWSLFCAYDLNCSQKRLCIYDVFVLHDLRMVLLPELFFL